MSNHELNRTFALYQQLGRHATVISDADFRELAQYLRDVSELMSLLGDTSVQWRLINHTEDIERILRAGGNNDRPEIRKVRERLHRFHQSR